MVADQSYAELLVSFTCRLFHLASPDRVAETVQVLVKGGDHNCSESKLSSHKTATPAIFGRIALNIITHHYEQFERTVLGVGRQSA